MAYQVVVTEYFEETTMKTLQWLESEWSLQSADKFREKIKASIERISKNPKTGMISVQFENVRSVPVTKHNRIYYAIKDDVIILLELFETKQSPKRNKYD